MVIVIVTLPSMRIAAALSTDEITVARMRHVAGVDSEQ